MLRIFAIIRDWKTELGALGAALVVILQIVQIILSGEIETNEISLKAKTAALQAVLHENGDRLDKLISKGTK